MSTISQTIAKKTNIPSQCIPFLCVFIIAKTPTILLAGFMLGYIMINKQKRLPYTPQEPKKLLVDSISSLGYSNEIQHASINHPHDLRLLSEEEGGLPSSNDASMEFESLMKFPSCPTTLPRLDTHFNFVSDHHELQQNNTDIDWSAIHKELEYDQQRQVVYSPQKQQSNTTELFLTHQDHRPSLPVSSDEEDDDEDEDEKDMHSLSSISSTTLNTDTTNTAGRLSLVELGAQTPIPFHHPNDASAAILHTEQEQPQDILLDDILLLPLPPKPSLSSPAHLFKSKLQQAVSKMKKSDQGSKKTTAAVTSPHPHYPSALSPRPSASARMHDHFKGRLNKLFRK